jgi:hypothetical protein
MRQLNRLGPFAVLAVGPALVGGLPPAHFVEGALAMILAVAMLVPLVVVTVSPGRARRGSLVDGADRRRPWLIAIATTLFASLLRAVDASTPTVRAVMLVAGAAIAVALSVDVRARLRLRRGLAGAERLRERTPDSPPIDAATAIYDFGLGDEEQEELAPPAAIYRERERVVRVVRGSRAAAEQALLHWIAFDVAILLPTLLTLAAATQAAHMYAY